MLATIRRLMIATAVLVLNTSVLAVTGVSASPDPAEMAPPDFEYWFAPPGDVGWVERLDAGAGFIAAADKNLQVVHVFQESGAFVRTLTGPGGGLGDFQGVAGVAISPNGRVVVSDTVLDRVSVFGPGGSHKFTFGSAGSGPGLFDNPWDVDVGANGRIYVADGGNARVQIFDAAGNYLDSIGPDIGGVKDPLGGVSSVAIASDGSVLLRHGFVNHLVYRVDLDGTLINEVSGTETGPSMSLDDQDRIWILGEDVVLVRTLENADLGSWNVATNTAPAFDSVGRAIIVKTRFDVYKFHQCNNRLATYVGTPNADFATGTAQDDVVVLRGGNDIYFGGPGRDTICGGGGADQLHGGTGRDNIYGQAGPDELYGNAHQDRLFGGSGLDVLRGGDGPDWLYGGKHADELRGGDGPDNLFGGNGPDDCFGGPGTDAATSCATTAGIP